MVDGIKDAVDKSTKEAAEIAKANFEDFWTWFTNQAGGSAEAIKKIGTQFIDISNAFKKMTSDVSGIGDSFVKVGGQTSKIFALIANNNPFKSFDAQGGAAVSTLVGHFDTLSERLGNFKTAAAAMGVESRVINMGKGAVRNYFEMLDLNKKVQAEMMNLAASTGNLNKFFDQQGHIISNITDMAQEMGTSFTNTAKATGLTTNEVSRYASTLGTIPGLLDKNFESGNKLVGGTNALTASLRLAAGAHVSVEEITRTLETAYDNLGNATGTVNDSIEKGFKLFSMMSEASNTLNIRFNDTKKFLTDVSVEFKNMGDNTEAATKMLGNFMNALRSTGLTTTASIDVIKNMISSVKGLEIGTKALISARSGGPGGLQGAFRIEQMIAQGKTDEVANMMISNLKRQFGGRIYTREEATQSPEAAFQFMRQRMLLQSGALGFKRLDEDQATKLLEALQKGTGATAIKEANSAVVDIFAKGLDVQQQHTSLLSKIEANTSQMISFGAGELAKISNLYANKNIELSESMNKAAAETPIIGRNEADLAKTNALAIKDFFKDAVNIGTTSIGDLTQNMKSMFQDFTAFSKSLVDEVKNQSLQKNVEVGIQETKAAVAVSKQEPQTVKSEITIKLQADPGTKATVQDYTGSGVNVIVQ